MRHVDLFSGIGGFALAAKWAEIETIQFVEKDLFCQKVLEKNFPDVPIHSDIKDFHYTGEVDLITGGFPCQPFSVAGKRKGKDDDRYLWPEMFRVIRECRPRWIIAENVPGIIPHLDPILKDLEREGYTWRAYLIPASAVGAPHKRERLWIVANATCSKGWRQYQAISKERSEQGLVSRREVGRDEPIITNANSMERNKGTENNESKPKRSEWQKSTAEIRNAISNSNSITSEQTDSGTVPKQKKWNTWERLARQFGIDRSFFNWKENKPPIPGVDDGIPNGVDRNKSLGNAIVPQIAYLFIKIILLRNDC